MKIAFHLMQPEPTEPLLDGAVQEAVALGGHFSGALHYLYPARRYYRWIPRSLCGLSQLSEIRKVDRSVDLHHLFIPEITRYPILDQLTRPMVCTLWVGPPHRPFSLSSEDSRLHLIVPHASTQTMLETQGWQQVNTISPGVDQKRFRPLQTEPQKPNSWFRILAASAPWNRRQFHDKGVDLLLEAAVEIPNLQLLFLWRGTQVDEMRRRISAYGLTERVELRNEVVDVPAVLSQVDGAIVLSRKSKFVKAFPQSLLETLATGRPVVVSQTLGMADFVSTHGCGKVVADFSKHALIRALRELIDQQRELTIAARNLDLSAFSQPAFFAAHNHLYQQVLGQ